MYKYASFLLALLIHLLLIFLWPHRSNTKVYIHNSTPNEGIELSHFKTISNNKKSILGPRHQQSQQFSHILNKEESRNLSQGNQLKYVEQSDHLISNLEDEPNHSAETSIFLATPSPHYPLLAKQKGLEGIVKLRAIYKNGIIEKVEIIESSGEKILDDSAVSTLLSWKIKKNLQGEFEKTFQFKLIN